MKTFRVHYVLVVLATVFLGGCCMGQWCLGDASSGKEPGVPPTANHDDRTNHIDPRVTPQ